MEVEVELNHIFSSPDSQDEESIDNLDSMKMSNDNEWWTLPEPVLLKIFHLLSPQDIVRAALTCKRWNSISNDDLLWRKQLQCDYKLEPRIPIKPGALSWKTEYKRLKENIPIVQTQCLEGHTHQVLHVSFSNNGQMFATCSKDGYVIIWNANHPCTEKFSHNMKQFSWKYTQYSQFNQTDTLLLVSGVYFGAPQSTSGEIAVFTVDGSESHYRCRVANRPYDKFGTWFSDQHLISGDIRWIEHLISCSELTINKANQEIHSEHVPIRNPLYKFYNVNASSIRAIMIANCPWLDDSTDALLEENTANHSPSLTDDSEDGATCSKFVGNPLSHATSLRRAKQDAEDDELWHDDQLSKGLIQQTEGTIQYLDEYCRKCSSNSVDVASVSKLETRDAEDSEEYDDLNNSMPKYLIFSTGSKTYTPHQVGIKRIRNVNFPKKLDAGPSLKERIAAKKLAEERRDSAMESDSWNIDAIQVRCDKIDKVIDMHGHIIGMALSPDHRYLYVNTRPWPQNYVISNPLEPPPIAQEIDIHIIDLKTLKRVGNMLRSHKAYTPSTECFFIFLDVCDEYVASGAEDMHAYLWDRYYGLCLAKYKHSDVVNSVAFNPRDTGMLVTTSDDYTIKIWRSRATCKDYDYDIVNNDEACESTDNNINHINCSFP